MIHMTDQKNNTGWNKMESIRTLLGAISLIIMVSLCGWSIFEKYSDQPTPATLDMKMAHKRVVENMKADTVKFNTEMEKRVGK